MEARITGDAQNISGEQIQVGEFVAPRIPPLEGICVFKRFGNAGEPKIIL
jgi:hypothetical protein